MSGMQARHQYAARRRADRIATVMASQSDSVGRQLIDICRADLGGTIATQVTIPQIIGQDEDNVRWPIRVGREAWHGNPGKQGERQDIQKFLHQVHPWRVIIDDILVQPKPLTKILTNQFWDFECGHDNVRRRA